jgi:hypothetical protein
VLGASEQAQIATRQSIGVATVGAPGLWDETSLAPSPPADPGRARGRPEPDDLRTAHRSAAIAPGRSDSAICALLRAEATHRVMTLRNTEAIA